MNYKPSVVFETRVTNPILSGFSYDPRNNLQVSQNIENHDFKPIYKSDVFKRSASLPCKPIWAFGMDVISKMINLTTNKNNWIICYSVSQLGIIYNHTTETMEFLMGHKNLITSMGINETGEWLVTADKGKDSTIIVWEVQNCFPVCTIFDPHPEVGVIEVGISQDARYLASVGAEPEPVIKFWLWTLGNEEADASYVIKKYHGHVKNIAFNSNDTTMFAITFSYSVLFCTWQEGKTKLTVKEGRIPRGHTRDFGEYSHSIYGPHTHDCYTVTSNGWVLIWGRSFLKVPFQSIPITNNKIFLKAIRLEPCGISTICYIDGCIQTVNIEGQIRFYDKDFKILFSFIKKGLPPAIHVGFNLTPRNYAIKNYEIKRDQSIDTYNNQTEEGIVMYVNSSFQTNSSIRKSEKKFKSPTRESVKIVLHPKVSFNSHSTMRSSEKKFQELQENLSLKIFSALVEKRVEKKATVTILDKNLLDTKSSETIDNYSNDKENIPENLDEVEDEIEIYEDYEIYLAQQLPSDFSLDRSPFIVRDFIILTMDGKCAYVDMPKNTCNYFLEMKYSCIVGIDVNSEMEIVIIAYEDNSIYSYDFESTLLHNKVNLSHRLEHFQGRISFIRYSPQGYFLVIGSTTGNLVFLDPITIEPISIVFDYFTAEILDIIFSEDNNYIAYRDADNTVVLLKMISVKSKINWICYGRTKAHSDEITGMMFCRVNRLFTIGKDRLLVEYNVKCSKPNDLNIVSQKPVLQTGYPTAFCSYELVNETNNIFFLIATNEHKYIVISEKQSTIERKTVAPTTSLEEFINQVEIIPNGENRHLVYRAGKQLGLQLLPISGNPYTYMGVIAHSSEISAFRLAKDGRYAFTYSADDTVCIMWDVKLTSVEYQCASGGRNLEPYVELIEGGRKGSFYQEIIDIFYFMQIIHQGDESPHPRNVSDKIAVAELPNFLRAIGYFPSEYELDNIMYEASSYYIHKALVTNENEGAEEDCISFDNCIKLYLNHRPAHSFTIKQIENAFRILEKDGPLSRVKFVELLCTKGEAFSPLTLHNCFATLLLMENKNVGSGPKSWRNLFQDVLPDVITLDYFLYEFLGIVKEN